MPDVATRIGILREKPLHASLKRWYARAGDRAEVAVDGYVIDLVRDELLIEVQTRGFSAIRPKIVALLARGHRVRIIHPIAIDRWIVNVDIDGAVLSRRRSPRHGSVSDIVGELVSFPDLLAHPRFEIEVLLTREDEHRRHEPGRCWRRKGWTVVERRLVDVVDRKVLGRTEDLASLLPDGLPAPFTTVDLAMRLGRPRRVAQQMAYCLRKVGLVEAMGMHGRAAAYRVVDPPPLVRGSSDAPDGAALEA
ncbi:MAG TPA: hypothetical protein VHK05_09150 [Candidatus Limnocylindrales bacterium]|nr:hypothetical protein [Candidatus Limnocylindrales bacterium]